MNRSCFQKKEGNPKLLILTRHQTEGDVRKKKNIFIEVPTGQPNGSVGGGGARSGIYWVDPQENNTL